MSPPFDHNKLDLRVPYRVGYPTLPVLPLETKHSSCPVYRTIELKIRDILIQEGVHVKAWSLVRRYRPDQDVTKVRKCVLVEADSLRDGHLNSWKKAIQKLLVLLRANELPYSIEIIDQGAVYGLITEPLSTNQPEILNIWPKIAEEIIDEVDEQEWVTLDCVLRGLDRVDAHSTPTVLISASDADDDIWWKQHLPRIGAKLPDGLRVELVQAKALFAGSESKGKAKEDTQDSYISANAYETTVKMGASIGLKGSSGSSTIGACIQLTKGGVQGSKFGLTNHHVGGDTKEEWNKNGWLAPTHPLVQKRSLIVMSPSDSDHKQLVTKTEEDLKKYKPLAQQTSSTGQKNVFLKIIDTHEATKKASTADRKLGNVHASSGWRTVADDRFSKATRQKWAKLDNETEHTNAHGSDVGWFVDWTLIEISPPRCLDPYVPEAKSSVRILEGAAAEYYITIDPYTKYDVAKCGRTTGWTTGQINPTASYMNLRSGDASSVLPVDLSHRFKHVGLACAIISSSKTQDFIASGDSGSVILLNQENGPSAYIVGLGFASNTSTMISYMVPFDIVVEDIERVTGAKVLRPIWAGGVAGEEPESR